MTPDELRRKITFHRKDLAYEGLHLGAVLRLEVSRHLAGIRHVQLVKSAEVVVVEEYKRMAEELVRAVYQDRREELRKAAMELLTCDPSMPWQMDEKVAKIIALAQYQ